MAPYAPRWCPPHGSREPSWSQARGPFAEFLGPRLCLGAYRSGPPNSPMSESSHHSIVFGPFKSPSLGSSLGINIAPARRSKETEGSIYDKNAPDAGEPIISMRRKVPSPGVIVTSGARRFIELSKAGDKFESLVVTGNYEPTSHPELTEIIENLRQLRDKWMGKCSLCLVSQNIDAEAPHLKHILGMFDKPIVRFEWGTAKSFATLTKRPSSDLKAIVDAISGVEKLILQACFTDGKSGNAAATEVRNWIKKVAEIRPREVYIGTADGKGQKALTPAKLEAIGAELIEATGVPARVFAAEALSA
jgi:hypothetical protein